MNKSITSRYLDNDIKFYRKDGHLYINATQMAQAIGFKRPGDFLKNKKTIKFMFHLSRSLNISNEDLARVVQGGIPNLQGTWMIEQLAIYFAAWLDPEIQIWLNNKIREISLNNISPTELMLKQAQYLVELEKKTNYLMDKVKVLERNQNKALERAEYPMLPSEVFKPTAKVPELTVRDKTIMLVNRYARNKGLDHHFIWYKLYNRFKTAYKINILVRGKNRGITGLDYAEKNGHIEKLYNLAIKLFK